MLKNIKLSWAYFVFECLMGVGAIIGIIYGVSDKLPYDERTYFFSLSIINLMLLFWWGYKYDKQKEIEKQKELKDKESAEKHLQT